MMASWDEPSDPQEALAAAEAAHLAERHAALRGSPAHVPPAQAPAGEPTAPRPRVGGPRRRAPLPFAAAVAAGWAAVVSIAPAVLVVGLLHATESGAISVTGAMRTGASGWLLAHGVPVHTSAGSIGLAPLALAALAAWRTTRAGVHVTRAIGARGSRRVRPAAAGAVGVAAWYGLCGALVAALVDGPNWQTPPIQSGLSLAGFGLVAAGYGALRTTGAGQVLAGRLAPPVREGVRAGLVAAAVLLAAGAAAAGIAVACGGGAAADTIAAYRTGVAGQAGLTLLCLAYAPNLAVWAMAYLVGPGFAVGTGTAVRGSEVVLGSLPPLPVFAGLPAGALPTLGAVLLVVPVLAGAVAGWLLARDPLGWARMVSGAAVSGLVAGLLLGLSAAASGGSLGDGHLASMGPVPLLVAIFSTGTVTVGAMLGVAVTAGLARR